MDSILIITDRTLHNAPRVIRQIECLKHTYHIHTVASTAAKQEVASHQSIKNIAPSILYRAYNKLQREYVNKGKPTTNFSIVRSKKIEKIIQSTNPKIIFVHECTYLPYITALKKKYNFKLVFNAHEYYPLEYDDKKNWSTTWQPYYEKMYASYLPYVDLFINVCESIRQKCITMFQKDSIVIPNAAFYTSAPMYTNDEQKIKIIHHGGAQPSRKIEEMIQVAVLLGKQYELHLMLTPSDAAYLEQLKKETATISNVKFIDTVPFNDIVPTINAYDIGLYILPPTNYNNSIALPNKLFEFIQAKLCIAIGPSPEMASVVDKYKLGIIADDFSAEKLAEKIQKLSKEEIYTYKKNCEKHAKELSAENYSILLLTEIKKLSN